MLTGEWILVSPHRLERPWQGQVEECGETDEPDYVGDCYLCPGNARAKDNVNPDYRGAFVFDNDFPALTPHSDITVSDTGFFQARAEPGRCRVVCYSENHSRRLSTMAVDDISVALQAFIREFDALDRESDIGYVQFFENRGRAMGCSNEHPHAQIWATELLPTEPARELAEQQNWYRKTGVPLLCSYRDAEIHAGTRIVATNEHFVTLVPYWATWPFETMLVPKVAFQAPPDMTPAVVTGLAAALKTILSAYDRLFQTAAPYSLGFHPRPSDGPDHPEWVFHAHIYPPLLRSASVRKHMVGFEMLAMPQRDITAEMAAGRLREHCS